MAELFNELDDKDYEIITKEKPKIKRKTRTIEVTGIPKQPIINSDGSLNNENIPYNKDNSLDIDEAELALAKTKEDDKKLFFLNINIEDSATLYSKRDELAKYDIEKLMRKSKSYLDFTVDELAAISYFNKETSIMKTPQLYYISENTNEFLRIYTYDLPWKLWEHYDVKIEFNDKGQVKPILLPFIEGWLSAEGITRYNFDRWLDSKNAKFSLLRYMYDVGKSRFKSLALQGMALGVLPSSAMIFQLKNYTSMRDHVVLETPMTTKVTETIDYDSLSNEELDEISRNPKLMDQLIRKSDRNITDDV